MQCTLDNDDKNVIVKILDTTFDISGGNHYIKMDTNFVKSSAYQEPLLGINENVWTFAVQKTEKEYTFTISTSGLLRLTKDGTNEFEKEQNQFFDTLLKELADACLIPQRHFSTNKKTQIDFSKDERQLLISIRIEETKDRHEKDVNSIIKDLNTMIESKDQTPIGQPYKKYVYGNDTLCVHYVYVFVNSVS